MAMALTFDDDCVQLYYVYGLCHVIHGYMERTWSVGVIFCCGQSGYVLGDIF